MIDINTKIRTVQSTIKLLENYKLTLVFEYKKKSNVVSNIELNKALLDDLKNDKLKETNQIKLGL